MKKYAVLLILAFLLVTVGNLFAPVDPVIWGGGGTTTTTNLIGNLKITSFDGGLNASSNTFWRGDGLWINPADSTRFLSMELGKIGMNTNGAALNQVPTWNGSTIIWATPPGAGGGEANTISSVGTAGSFALPGVPSKVGIDLKMKGLIPGTGISFISNATDITISSTASGGDFKADGSVAMTGPLNYGGQKGTNIADGTVYKDVASYGQVTNMLTSTSNSLYTVTSDATNNIWSVWLPNYLKTDGSNKMLGSLNMGGQTITNMSAGTTALGVYNITQVNATNSLYTTTVGMNTAIGNATNSLINKDGSIAMTASLNMGGQTVTNAANATTPTGLVPLQQLNASNALYAVIGSTNNLINKNGNIAMTASLNMGGQTVTNAANATTPTGLVPLQQMNASNALYAVIGATNALLNKDGSIAMTASLNMGGQTVTNAANATTPTGLVPLQQLNASNALYTLTSTFNSGTNTLQGNIVGTSNALISTIGGSTNVTNLRDAGVVYSNLVNSLTQNLYVTNAGTIFYAESLQLSTNNAATIAAGKFRWNDTDKTVDLGLNANVTLQLGQETHLYARNAQGGGVTINNGQACYLYGATGTRASVRLANASSATTSHGTIGVATENIPNGDVGFVTVLGIVRDLDTSAWNEGDILYLGTVNGNITNAPPVAPNHHIRMGVVITKNATTGTIFVNPKDNGAMEELSDVSLLNLASGHTLLYNGVGGYWTNGVITSGGGSGDFKADGSVAMTGPLNFGNQKGTNMANGTVTLDAVNYGQLVGATNNILTNAVNLNGGTGTNLLSRSGYDVQAYSIKPGSGITFNHDGQTITIGSSAGGGNVSTTTDNTYNNGTVQTMDGIKANYINMLGGVITNSANATIPTGLITLQQLNASNALYATTVTLGNATNSLINKDGSIAMTASLNMGNQTVTNAADASTLKGLATIGQINATNLLYPNFIQANATNALNVQLAGNQTITGVKTVSTSLMVTNLIAEQLSVTGKYNAVRHPVVIYGQETNNADPYTLNKNGIFLDGVTNGDRFVEWGVTGRTDWAIGTYRSEDSEFMYLHEHNSRKQPITISQAGRVGINKLSDVMNYHSLFTGSGVDDMVVGGTFGIRRTQYFSVKIDGTGNPNTYAWATSWDAVNYTTNYTGVSCTVAPALLTNGVTVAFASTTGHTLNDSWRFTGYPQMPIGTLTVNPSSYTEILTVTNYTLGTGWKDRTYDANSIDSTPFLMLTNGTDSAVYAGDAIKRNSVYVVLDTPAQGATLVVEYWNGSAWTPVTAAMGLYDGTSNLQTSGAITWTKSAMTGWTKENLTVEDYVNQLYWIRLRSSSSITTAPIAKLISPNGSYRFAAFASTYGTTPSFFIDPSGDTYMYRRAFVTNTATSGKEVVNLDLLRSTILASQQSIMYARASLNTIVGTYSNLWTAPAAGSTTVSITGTGATTTQIPIVTFMTTNTVGVSVFPAGTYHVIAYGSVNSTAGTVSRLAARMFIRSGGVDTYFTTYGTSAPLTTTANTLYEFDMTLAAPQNCSPTDYVGVTFYGTNNNATARNITLAVEGTTATRVNLPLAIGTASQNVTIQQLADASQANTNFTISATNSLINQNGTVPMTASFNLGNQTATNAADATTLKGLATIGQINATNLLYPNFTQFNATNALSPTFVQMNATNTLYTTLLTFNAGTNTLQGNIVGTSNALISTIGGATNNANLNANGIALVSQVNGATNNANLVNNGMVDFPSLNATNTLYTTLLTFNSGTNTLQGNLVGTSNALISTIGGATNKANLVNNGIVDFTSLNATNLLYPSFTQFNATNMLYPTFVEMNATNTLYTTLVTFNSGTNTLQGNIVGTSNALISTIGGSTNKANLVNNGMVDFTSLNATNLLYPNFTQFNATNALSPTFVQMNATNALYPTFVQFNATNLLYPNFVQFNATNANNAKLDGANSFLATNTVTTLLNVSNTVQTGWSYSTPQQVTGVTDTRLDVSKGRFFQVNLPESVSCTITVTNTLLSNSQGMGDGQMVLIRVVNPSANVANAFLNHATLWTNNYAGDRTTYPYTNNATVGTTDYLLFDWQSGKSKWRWISIKKGYD